MNGAPQSLHAPSRPRSAPPGWRAIPFLIGATTAALSGLTAAAGASSARTYVGAAVHQNYGPVQVTITVVGEHMTKIRATAPEDNARSHQINNRAVPILDREALKAQSVRGVHKVSGASLTTTAFEASLANAMAKAHLTGA